MAKDTPLLVTTTPGVEGRRIEDGILCAEET